MDKLDCIKVFTHVARLGSFTAVANELNMTQGAVSKKIAWLESSIGFSLFHRTSRKITLTNSGEQYLNYSNKVLEEMIYTEQKLKGELSEAIGELKISAPSAFATQRLVKPVSKFMELNPRITLNLSVNDKQVDLYKDDIDIAIRASFLNDSGLKARKLLHHELCYFASPGYIERHCEPLLPSELLNHKCITYSLSNPSNIWHLDNQKYNANEITTSDSPELIVQLALAGVGIAAMPKWMVESYFKQGKLIEVFREFDKHSLPMYAVYKSVDFLPYRIRAFIDFLCEYFEAESK
ncbi:LysR family transcriptional regulator [Thalassotalea sp. M1531]|uniref:LysR family transcriptional regulator n=1 Tax=Thalassotalea algicola TaxID=2716224 RepID=A0A7Y0LCZ2_9GAMM|nr:LysR family transcriptional regulator [Thalassotalea algicola]NMP30865.1 LysR family transcriptional regulator [Thalassotalea algicola]